MQTTNILNLLREKEVKLQREIAKAIMSIVGAKSLSRELIKSRYGNVYTGAKQYLRLIKASNSESNFAAKEDECEKKETEEKTDGHSFTCPNPKCEKPFASPITVQNLTHPNKTPYYACPYCLTEIRETSENQPRTHRRSKTELSITQPVQTKPAQEPYSQKCAYHFGYLGKRSKDEKIPDECMICEKLIDCTANTNERSEYDLVLAT